MKKLLCCCCWYFVGTMFYFPVSRCSSLSSFSGTARVLLIELSQTSTSHLVKAAPIALMGGSFKRYHLFFPFFLSPINTSRLNHMSFAFTRTVHCVFWRSAQSAAFSYSQHESKLLYAFVTLWKMLIYCKRKIILPSPQPAFLVHAVYPWTAGCFKDCVWWSVLTPSDELQTSYVCSLMLAEGWEMTDVHLGRKSHPELHNGNPQIHMEIMWYVNRPFLQDR